MNGSVQSKAHLPNGEDPAEISAPPIRPELEEMAAFYQHSACGHHCLDPNGNFRLINDTELEWLGYRRDEVVGKLRFADLCTESSRSAFEENFRAFKAGGRRHNVEYDLVRKDGSILPVLLNATPVRGPDGAFVKSRATVIDLSDRRKVEDRLRQALDEQEDLYENAPCGYHSISANGLFLRMNRTELRWLGYERGEVVGKLGLMDVLTPESLPAFERNLRVLKETGYVGDVELEFRRKDGTVFPVRVYATAVFDERCRFVSSRTTVVDLTSRREMEEILGERDRFIRRIADATPNLVFVFEIPRNRLIYGNRELSRVLGLTEAQIASMGEDLFSKLLHPDDLALRNSRREAYGSVSDDDVLTFEYRLRHADGSWRWMHSRNVVFERDADGRPTHILGIAQDVTRQKEAEERLAHSETLYRTLVETVPVGIGWSAPDGRLNFASSALCRLLGAASDAEVKGTRIDEWLATKPVPGSGERRRSPRPRGKAAEVALRRRDGTTFWAEMVTEPLVGDSGQFDGQIVAVRDVTERRQASERISRDGERLQFLSRRIVEVQEEERRHLARELHDEIGQTLTAILYRLEALKASPIEDPGHVLGETIWIADEAIGKIRDLSLFLRPTQLDVLGLAATLEAFVDRLALRKGHRVELSICPSEADFPPEIRIACFRVVQEALTNVVRHARARSVSIAVGKEADFAELLVRDDGGGFDVSDARRRAAAGRSVGLFSMEERVELLGGRLEIRSAPGQGTEISARLPLHWGRPEGAG